MKEAAGEANMTVVTIILIGIVVAIATPIITNIMTSTKERTCCVDAGGQWSGGECTDGNGASVNFDKDCSAVKGS